MKFVAHMTGQIVTPTMHCYGPNLFWHGCNKILGPHRPPSGPKKPKNNLKFSF